MNCQWAEQVALLEPPTPELAAHLAVCADCRELRAELEADQVLLQQPPDVPEGVVAGAVLRRVAVRRLRLAPLALAAAAALTFLMVRQPAPPPAVTAPVPVVRNVIPDPVIPAAPEPVHQVRRAPRSPRAVQADPDKLMASLAAMLEPAPTAIASADTSVLITTQTADPDVVIVLVPENTGDEE